MSPLEVDVVRVDAHDRAGFDAWFDVMAAGARAGRPAPLVWEREDLRALLEGGEGAAHVLAAARRRGEVVGTLLVELLADENAGTADVDVTVAVPQRRRGVGRRLWATALEVLAEHGCARAEGGVHVVDDDTPGVAFAEVLGFRAVHEEQHLALALPVAADLLADAPRPPEGHELVAWAGHAPDALVESYAACRTAMARDVPGGTSAREAEAWDVGRVRAAEDVAARQGRTTLVTAALAPDREVVGYTVLTRPAGEGADLYQGDTWVRADHRGAGLGAALKVANLRRLDRDRAGWVHTWTDELNTPMTTLNRRLGFRRVEDFRAYERDVP